MLFKNHFSFALVLTGSLFISAELHAENFTSLSQCRQHFQTSVQTGSRNIAEMDAWCKTKMTELDFCAESALLTAMASNSFSAAQLPQIRSGFEARCRQEIAARANGANGVAGTTPTATNGTPGAAFDANGVPQPPRPPAQTNCAAVAAEQQAACTMALQNYQAQLRTYQSNLQAYQQRLAATEQARRTQQNAQQQQQAGNNMQAMQMMMGMGMQMANQAGQAGGGVPNYAAEIKVPDGFTITQPSTASGPQSVPQIQAAQNAPANAPVAAQANAPTPAASAVGAAAKDAVGAVGQGAAPAAKAIEEAPFDPNKVEPPKTSFTMQAEERKKKGEAIIKEGENVLALVQKGTDKTYAFKPYVAAAEATNTQYDKYITQKEPCVQESERANKLCIEGNSPGAKAAKALVDYSGPILGAMSSAVNACSSTKKVMNLAQLGMTVAKGVCVASKLSCDSKCAASFKNLSQVTVALEKEMAALPEEATAGEAFCHAAGTKDFNTANTAPPSTLAAAKAAYTATHTACMTDLETKLTKAQAYSNKMQMWAKDEQQVKGGTTNEMIANCNAKGKDIALMATNILTMAMGKMSAQKCEKDLSTSGGVAGAGGNPAAVTTAEYCADPTTKGSDFCKCQTNPSAEGCAGGIAVGGTGALPVDRNGVALNLQKGPNGFAGGSGGGKPGSSGITVGTGGGSSFGSGGAAAQLNSGNGAYGAGSSAALGATASGGAGSGGGDAQAAGANGEGPSNDKKWSFGAFSSMSGGGGGGGRGGGSGGGGNGNMSQEQQAAIERKLASDRYAAEVTTSTGPNNFDKIKDAVRLISDSLEPNQ